MGEPLGPAQVDRHVRAGDVGDGHVERRQPVQQPGGEHHPCGPGGERGHREVADLVDQPLRYGRLLRLRGLRRRVRELQPVLRVRGAGGQRGQHGRHLVTQCALAGRVADGHRDHRDQRRLGQCLVVGEPPPQRARAHRKDDVVDRDPVGVLDRLDDVKVHAAECHPAVRRDRLVERGGRGPARRGRDDLAVAAVQAQDAADEAARGRRQGRQHAHHFIGETNGLHGPPCQPRSGEDGIDCYACNKVAERLGRGQVAAGRAEVEQDGEQFHAGGAVDRGVVDLGVDGGALLGQPGDQVDLP